MQTEKGGQLGLSKSSDTSIEVDRFASKKGNSVVQLDELQVEGVARRLSLHSRDSKSATQDENVFFAAEGSNLDPKSPSFSARAWLKAFLRLQSRDPEKFVIRTAGVAFRGLNVYGTSETALDFKSTVGNIPLTLFGFAKRLVGLGIKRKVQILRDFDGLLDAGEMLLVLGPPGRLNQTTN